MSYWKCMFEELNKKHPDSGFEELIRIMINEEIGYACEKRNILGQSGNHYEFDAISMIKNRQNDRYLHLINVRDTKISETNNSTWYNSGQSFRPFEPMTGVRIPTEHSSAERRDEENHGRGEDSSRPVARSDGEHY